MLQLASTLLYYISARGIFVIDDTNFCCYVQIPEESFLLLDR